MKVRLDQVAHARSGDKGDASNVGLIADSPELFELLRAQATAERVKQHFRKVCRGPVERFEVPNLRAFNFLLHDSLGGGGTESLKTDAQGKTHAQGLLQMEIEVPDGLVPNRSPRRRDTTSGQEGETLGDGSRRTAEVRAEPGEGTGGR